MSSTAERVDGDALLRAAHESGYRLPAGFGGFTARLSADDATATVTVRGPRDVVVENSTGEDRRHPRGERHQPTDRHLTVEYGEPPHRHTGRDRQSRQVVRLDSGRPESDIRR